MRGGIMIPKQFPSVQDRPPSSVHVPQNSFMGPDTPTCVYLPLYKHVCVHNPSCFGKDSRVFDNLS